MKLSDLVIDIQKTLEGSIYAVEEGRPYEGYKEGVKAGLEGIAYTCMSEGLNYDKITVKIPGNLTPAFHYEGKPIPVELENLDGKAWMDYRNGEIKLSLTASAIHVISEKKQIKILGGKDD